MEKLYRVDDLAELDAVAKDILSLCDEERVFALEGKMGAGKTTFTKVLCRALGCEDNVCSPTFAIVNVYFSESEGEIYHFDFYRIDSIKEVEEIGVEEYLYSGCYCFMEWSERVKEILPEHYVRIEIEPKSEKAREIRLIL